MGVGTAMLIRQVMWPRWSLATREVPARFSSAMTWLVQEPSTYIEPGMMGTPSRLRGRSPSPS